MARAGRNARKVRFRNTRTYHIYHIYVSLTIAHTYFVPPAKRCCSKTNQHPNSRIRTHPVHRAHVKYLAPRDRAALTNMSIVSGWPRAAIELAAPASPGRLHRHPALNSMPPVRRLTDGWMGGWIEYITGPCMWIAEASTAHFARRHAHDGVENAMFGLRAV